MKRLLLAVMMLALAPLAFAQMQGMDMKDMDMKGMKSDKKADQVHKADGTVTKLDREKGKVTIKHGPVSTLNWPSMTMTFDVKDKALLGKTKEGAKVAFSFVQSGKNHVITDIK